MHVIRKLINIRVFEFVQRTVIQDRPRKGVLTKFFQGFFIGRHAVTQFDFPGFDFETLMEFEFFIKHILQIHH